MKRLLLLILCFTAACSSPAQKPPPHTPMDSIMSQLEYVFKTDQQYRIPLDSTIKKYGINSPQVDSLMDLMSTQDSINLGIVAHIIDTYGWLGPDSIGPGGETTLWVVIQHSDLGVQQ